MSDTATQGVGHTERSDTHHHPRNPPPTTIHGHAPGCKVSPGRQMPSMSRVRYLPVLKETPGAGVGQAMRSAVRLAYFLIATPYFFNTTHRPKPRSRDACSNMLMMKRHGPILVSPFVINHRLFTCLHVYKKQQKRPMQMQICTHQNNPCTKYIITCQVLAIAANTTH